MTKGVTFVLFGGTGDLTKRKLVPAFSNLMHEREMPNGSLIVGVSRRDFSDREYKDFLLKGIRDKDQIRHIKSAKIKHFKGDFSGGSGLDGLKGFLKGVDGGKNDRVFYLATGYGFFGRIVKQLGKQGLNVKRSKVVFEKPFGGDLKSSDKLDIDVHKVFKERQVYRIDHYLAKETVQNLQVLKFTNPLLSSNLNNKYVESVEVVIDESLGAGNRLEYYDSAGAIKDMIQNHLLQVLSLTLMRRPKKLDSEGIHKEKVRILRAFELAGLKEQLLGQYKSYAKELGRKSKTETFAKIVLNCKVKEWDGVKLVLRTGKKLKKKFGKIRINFKELGGESKEAFEGVGANKIRIDIYPKQNVRIFMNSRSGKCESCVEPVKFEFCKECRFGPNSVNGYSTLIREVIEGDKTLFATSDGVRAAWKVVEKIDKARSKIRFVKYNDCSDPERA